jgi:hypothetical protein
MNMNFESKAIALPWSGCWIWMGSMDKCGYGKWGGKLAHRLVWQATRGDIPRGMEVCHSCDVPSCINPEHLFVGTHLENMRDSVRKGRFNAGKYLAARTHCVNGHEYNEANTFHYKGSRYCRRCNADSHNRRRAT